MSSGPSAEASDLDLIASPQAWEQIQAFVAGRLEAAR